MKNNRLGGDTMHRLERAAVMLESRAAARRTMRGRERGSQSLEWVGLGAVVMAIMAAAYKTADSHGGVVGQAFIDNLARAIEPSH